MANERPSAFRLYAEDHPRLTGTLRARLEKARGELLEQLLNPLANDAYQRKAGTILGLDEAIQMCIQTITELAQQDR